MQIAMLNPAKVPEISRDRIKYVGIASNGIEVQMIFEKTGKLVTAFPLLK